MNLNRLSWRILKYRVPIIFIAIGISILFALNLRNIGVEPEFENYLPPDMPTRIANHKIDSIFGGNKTAVLVVESDNILQVGTLKRVYAIAKAIDTLDICIQLISPFHISYPDKHGSLMKSKKLIPVPPASPKDIDVIKLHLSEHPEISKIVISEDKKKVGITAVFKKEADDQIISASIEQIIEDNPGSELIHKGGLPFVRMAIQKDINRDMMVLLPLGMLIMLIVLQILFRQKRGIWLPFSVVLMSIVLSMGIMPELGWKVSVVTILLPVISIAIANDYGIHMISCYQEVNSEGSNMSGKTVAFIGLRALILPITITGITTIAGILGLLAHILVPARQLGVLAALSIVFALILSITFIPSFLSLLSSKKKVIHSGYYQKNRVGRTLSWFGNIIASTPKTVLAVNILIITLAVWGTTRVKTDANVENFFSDKHPVKVSTNLIAAHFGGTQVVSVLVEGDLSSPDLIKRIDTYTDAISAINGVGTVNSISQIVKRFTKARFSPKSVNYNKIPDSEKLLKQIYRQISVGGEKYLSRFADKEYKHSQIIIRVHDASTSSINSIIKQIKSLTANDPNVSLLGGTAVQQADLATLIIKGQVISLIAAVCIVLLLMILLFRSLYAGIISAAPLSGAMAIIFGLMGFLGIKLDIATAMLSSILIGVGVDYTIHFLWRFREERLGGLSHEDAVHQTITTTGRGILFNALSVMIGFSICMFSAFTPIRFFGFLIVVSIFSCLFGALVLVPSIILIFKPRFLDPKDKVKQ